METVDEIRTSLKRLTLEQRQALEIWIHEFNRSDSVGLSIREASPRYSSLDPPFMTLEQFFQLEESSETRHEYVDGAIFAMSSPSVAHERIRHRLVMAIGKHVAGSPCQVFSSGMQLLIRRDTSDLCYYPDLMVDCRPHEWGSHFVSNPTLVLEILSPSTQLTDRREKLHNYRSIDSVQEYALVAQDEPKLTLYRRADGWRPQVCLGPKESAEFRSLNLTLPMTAIYDDILGEKMD